MTKTRIKVLPLIITALLGTSAIGATAAAPKGLQETVVVEPGRTVTPRQAQVISRTAAHVLMYIAEARSAIQAKDRARADKLLGEARAWLEVIKAERPTTKVIDHIRAASSHLDYKDTESVGADLIPIYAELDEIGDLVPVQAARKHLDQASEALKKGEKAKAKTALDAVTESLIYTELDLPIAATEARVIEAQKALASGDTQQADQALDKAEAGVVYLSVDMESPLALARGELTLARQDYAAKRYAEVKRDLEVAKRWLDQAAKGSDPAAVAEAQALGKRVDDLLARLAQGSGGLEKRIEGVWHQARSMAEREAEKASIGWKASRPDVAKNDHLVIENHPGQMKTVIQVTVVP